MGVDQTRLVLLHLARWPNTHLAANVGVDLHLLQTVAYLLDLRYALLIWWVAPF